MGVGVFEWVVDNKGDGGEVGWLVIWYLCPSGVSRLGTVLYSLLSSAH